MSNVFLTSEQQIALPRSKEDFFLAACGARQISCERNPAGDYVLIPPLHGKSIVLYSSDQTDEKEVHALKLFAQSITAQGALVLFSSPGSMRNDIMRILGIQIIISISLRQKSEGKGKLRFFYSLRKKQESLRAIASIIKQLAQDNIFNYQIASPLDFWRNCRQYKLFFAQIPTVLIEADELNPEERGCLEKALVGAVLEFCQQKPLAEQARWVQDLIEHLREEEPLADLQETAAPEETEALWPPNYPALELVAAEIPDLLAGEEKEDGTLKKEERGGGQKAIGKKAAKPVKNEKSRGKSIKRCSFYPPDDGPVFSHNVPLGKNDVPVFAYNALGEWKNLAEVMTKNETNG